MVKEKEMVVGFRCSQKIKSKIQAQAKAKKLTVSDFLRSKIHLITQERFSSPQKV